MTVRNSETEACEHCKICPLNSICAEKDKYVDCVFLNERKKNMLYCNDCGTRKGWPTAGQTHVKELGACECCGKQDECNSVPPRQLPGGGKRTLPCYIVFQNDAPEMAFFDLAEANLEVFRRQEALHLVKDHNPEGVFIYIHVQEVRLVDRRKGNRE